MAFTGRRFIDECFQARGTLASVIEDEPKWERVPAKVQRLVRSCLKKDPKQRLQAIGDWGLLLDEEPAPPAKARATKVPWIALTVRSAALDTSVAF
jgi:hypothetical protein